GRDPPPALPPALPGIRAERHQADVEPVDGPVRVLVERLAGILRRSVETDPRSAARAARLTVVALRRTAGEWRSRRALVDRQREERDLHGGAEVPDRRQRAVRSLLGRERWREPRDAARLRGTVLPEQRPDRRSARPQDGSAGAGRRRVPVAGGDIA